MKNCNYIFFFILISIQLNSQIYQDISVDDADILIQNMANKPMFTIIDVRTISEYNTDHLENADTRNFYDADFATQLDSLDKCRAYLIYCQSGNRSGQAFSIMQSLGFEEVYNMLGGISSWRTNGYPTTTIIPQFDNIYRPQLRIKNNCLELLNENFNPTEFILTGDFSQYSVQLKDYFGNILQDYSSVIVPITFDLSNPSGPYQVVITHQSESSLSMEYMLE